VKNFITFNKPYFSGEEIENIHKALQSGKISGNGDFTKKCQDFFQERYGFGKVLLTTSCTDALEMAAILLNIVPGDEVIMPSYTFVSTANPFILRGAKVVFCDSRNDHPGMDEASLKALITPKTKTIVSVHYAGVACDMDVVNEIAKAHNLTVVEDAAQAIDSFYTGANGIKSPLGSLGHLAAFSFHETKNIQCGEGGMLAINDNGYADRSEIIWEKGTNRSAFFRGEVDKYGWVDIGSSFLPSDIIAAFLYAQLKRIDDIQKRRLEIWNFYNDGLLELEALGKIKLPFIPSYATNNAHMFYIVCADLEERTSLLEKLKANNINAVFHYISLHNSNFYLSQHDGRELFWSEKYSNSLLRLPFYYDLTISDLERIIETIRLFYGIGS